MAQQTVTLTPGQSKLVTFEAIPHEAKTYQVSVDGLTGSFRAVSPLEVPRFSVVIGVSDTTPDIGEAISWWVDVTNISDAAAIPRIDWYIDGVTPGHSHIPPLAPGASRRVVYWSNVSFSTSGSHTLGVKVGTGDGASIDGVVAEITIEVIAPPTSNYLLMTKTELYSYLINGSVARDWWAMSYADRRALGLKIIQWWSIEWFGYVYAYAFGEPNCAGAPPFTPFEEEEDGLIHKPGGMENESAIRYALFTNHTVAPTNVYWWRKADDKWHCYNHGVSFKLPTAVAIGSADWLNALQIDKDVSKLSSWIFFQIDYNDIKPGGWRWKAVGWSIGINEVIGINPTLVYTKLGKRIVDIWDGGSKIY